MRNIHKAILAGVAGCTLSQPISAFGLAQEKVIYSFCTKQKCTDGEAPYASVLDVNGTLYGTTAFGGGSGSGVVFALDPATGAENVLYSFATGNPTSSLVDMKGALYGTTYTGGAYGNGTLYTVSPDTGTTNVIYSFGNDHDGSNPYSALVRGGGTLYGTTEYGGAHGAGTVFALRPGTGAEQVLHSFCSRGRKCADGAYPYAGLVNVSGKLYGTTEYGGGAGCEASGCGTVFSLDPGTAVEKRLYAFCSERKCLDGEIPSVGLIALNGMLYGVTGDGGAAHDGTLFAVDPATGAESVLYSFCSKTNCTDGAVPDAALLAVHGKLYGTTWAGGSHDGGTVFSLDLKNGTETVLHAFGGGTDGQNPGAALIDVAGTLYGTTYAGGTSGGGAVFSLRIP